MGKVRLCCGAHHDRRAGRMRHPCWGGAAGAVDAYSLARVRPAGKLVVSSSSDVTYSYRDPKTSRLAGNDYDTDQAIAYRPGVKAIDLCEMPIAGSSRRSTPSAAT
jgi:hypothetical protein